MNPNPNNYTSLEMSRKLVEAGIVLETSTYYVKEKTNEADCYELMYRIGEWFYLSTEAYYLRYKVASCEYYPAFSMSELWMELPNDTRILKGYVSGKAIVWISDTCESIMNANPCDALAELLIYVRKEGRG